MRSTGTAAAWYGSPTSAVLLGLLLASLLVQARTVFLGQRPRELQALVNERTAELEIRSDELRAGQRQLELIAYNDPLTGLPNRRLFEDGLKHRVAIMRVTGSIGTAQCPNQGSTTDSLYKAADTALYDAKRSGRNMWSWYSHGVKLRARVSASAATQ
jgi:PleD family two-component response regulator